MAPNPDLTNKNSQRRIFRSTPNARYQMDFLEILDLHL
jgi:hypothetical protein